MKPERWGQVKKILDEVLSVDPAQRETFLDKACAGDRELRSEVESLLASHEQAGTGFLKSPAADLKSGAALPTASIPGRHIGVYQVIEEIGHGGMGEVYRADRADGQYSKEVAIKLVRGGWDTASVLERFRNERQILASLDHPNIARLLDGGTTDDGIPYLVMELIEGQPIDKFCDQRKLNITERLTLFRQVCAAVQFAHQRLVIHRDIKPSNILVTLDGTPKLLDFGIAKIVEPFHDAKTTLTQAMTPEYASPEQIKGEPITTATDVYSLGVVLYQLLTGLSPYQGDTSSPHKLAMAVCQTDPGRPSALVIKDKAASSSSIDLEQISSLREGSVVKLRRRLAGDLDDITMMALRKEPSRRYGSVAQFAEDIRRHLEGLPVAASKGSWRYRAGKFVTRHKVAFAAAVIVTLAVAAGVVATVREARIAQTNAARAQKRFDDVRNLAKSLIFEVHDSIQDIPGTTAARQLIVSRSLEYLDSLGHEAAGDASLQSELATAYMKVGDAQGQAYMANLGDTSGSLNSYRKALQIREALVAADPQNKQNRFELARCQSRVGDKLAKMGDMAGATAAYEKTVALTTDLLNQDSSNLQVGHELFLTLTRLGYVAEDSGSLPRALEMHQKALHASQQLLERHAMDSTACRDLRIGLANVGDLLAKSGKVREGLEIYRKNFEVCGEVEAADPQHKQTKSRDWIVDYIKVADMLTQLGNKSEALDNYDKAKSIAQQLSNADPNNAQARSDLSMCHESVGKAQIVFKDGAAAAASFRHALQLREQLANKDPNDAEVQNDLILSYTYLGDAYVLEANRPNRSSAQRIQNWKNARAALQGSAKLLTVLQQKGVLTGADAARLPETAKKIAQCGVELRKLGASLD
jgi:eukaryotic-like serine/threonine-protein kinase